MRLSHGAELCLAQCSKAPGGQHVLIPLQPRAQEGTVPAHVQRLQAAQKAQQHQLSSRHESGEQQQRQGGGKELSTLSKQCQSSG